ncbi:ankyrin repeat domain-containing protein, partial [Candidatus Micrarchaeota archaeon]|nr:ankyrin repeat domain-containing protein [Candidatus Micrarchaeota archaeon]
MKLFHPSKFVKGETASQRPISKFTAASVLTSALGCGSGALTVPLETPKPVYHEEKTAEAKQDAREKVPEAKQVAPAVQPPEEKIDLNAELLGAAKKGETARAAKLIEKGTDVNAKNDDAWTALTHASRKGHAEVAEILVAKG